MALTQQNPHEMSPAEMQGHLAERLVEDHGDTPEVREVIELINKD